MNINQQYNYFTSCNKFFKYGDKYRNSLLSNKNHKENNKDMYDDLIKHKLINTMKIKYIPEYYIKEQYTTINKIMEYENYSNLIKNNILDDYKIFFTKNKIHDKLNINLDIKDPKIKGTLLDGVLSYYYDKTINLFEYICLCNDESIKNLIHNKNILNSDDFIKEVLGNQIDDIKKILDLKYKNIKSNMFVYNHSLKSYGNPDLIADDVIIDIKTSKNEIITSSNYCQIISYGILMNIHNVCLYDIENGVLYEGYIKDIEKIKKYIETTAHNHFENKKIENNYKFFQKKQIL